MVSSKARRNRMPLYFSPTGSNTGIETRINAKMLKLFEIVYLVFPNLHGGHPLAKIRMKQDTPERTLGRCTRAQTATLMRSD
jgi:hypothetical protein